MVRVTVTVTVTVTVRARAGVKARAHLTIPAHHPARLSEQLLVRSQHLLRVGLRVKVRVRVEVRVDIEPVRRSRLRRRSVLT